MKKLKIAIVCHFSNSMVREHLPLDNRKLYNAVRRLLGLTPKTGGYNDVAGWNTNFINNFKVREDIDLTVISAHSGLKKKVVHFEAENVQYYFVRCDGATLLKRLIKSPYWWHKLNPMRPFVRKIVRKINPDVVALVGAENAYISGTILGLEKDYPILMKAQTIYNNPDRYKYGIVDAKNAYVEKLIFDSVEYVSLDTSMFYQLFQTLKVGRFYNFKWDFGTTFAEVTPIENKDFDFVNFAFGISEAKGFGDAIRALAIVRKTHPNVKMNLVGGQATDYFQVCKSLVTELGLDNNVIFTPSFELQEEVFQHIQKSRFAVLPYKIDFISSTTYQAMHYELPTVLYRTQGTPTLNSKKKCVLIADMEDVQQLAEKMLILLENPEIAEELRKNAKEFVDYQNDGKRISDEIMAAFHAVDDHFHRGTPIPDNLNYIP